MISRRTPQPLSALTVRFALAIVLLGPPLVGGCGGSGVGVQEAGESVLNAWPIEAPPPPPSESAVGRTADRRRADSDRKSVV